MYVCMYVCSHTYIHAQHTYIHAQHAYIHAQHAHRQRGFGPVSKHTRLDTGRFLDRGRVFFDFSQFDMTIPR